MAITDITVLCILAFLALSGARRGFIYSIIGPLAFLIGSATGYIWFLVTRQFMTALIIAALGPLILSWTARLVISHIRSQYLPTPLSPASRCAGAFVNMLCGAGFILAMVVAGIIFPLKAYGLGDISDDIASSRIYSVFRRPLESIGAISARNEDKCLSGLCSLPEEKKKNITEDEDVQALMNDPHVKKMLADTAIQAAIQKRDIGALLSNPLIQELSKDPQFISRALRVYPKVQEQTAK